MDALTFATPRLVRNLCAAASAKLPITEYEHEKVLEGLKLTADQFVDLCILCGCDYCGSIKSESSTEHATSSVQLILRIACAMSTYMYRSPFCFSDV